MRIKAHLRPPHLPTQKKKKVKEKKESKKESERERKAKIRLTLCLFRKSKENIFHCSRLGFQVASVVALGQQRGRTGAEPPPHAAGNFSLQ